MAVQKVLIIASALFVQSVYSQNQYFGNYGTTLGSTGLELDLVATNSGLGGVGGYLGNGGLINNVIDVNNIGVNGVGLGNVGLGNVGVGNVGLVNAGLGSGFGVTNVGVNGLGFGNTGLIGAGLGTVIGGGAGVVGTGLEGVNFNLNGLTIGSSSPLIITNISPIGPSGLAVASDNMIEGTLLVSGSLPFLSAVAFDGTLPTAGTGVATCGCGNGAVGIIEGFPTIAPAPPIFGIGGIY